MALYKRRLNLDSGAPLRGVAFRDPVDTSIQGVIPRYGGRRGQQCNKFRGEVAQQDSGGDWTKHLRIQPASQHKPIVPLCRMGGGGGALVGGALKTQVITDCQRLPPKEEGGQARKTTPGRENITLQPHLSPGEGVENWTASAYGGGRPAGIGIWRQTNREWRQHWSE